MDDCCSNKGAELERLAHQGAQRRVLIAVLAINAMMFVAEFAAGIVAGSAALMADAVDMLGDALVYGLSLYALNKGDIWKARAAVAKGIFILLLGAGVFYQLGVKVLTGVPPESPIMFAFGAAALVANVICLSLLWRFRSDDVNMASTFECSRNDVIANVGVLVAAAGVMAFNSIWPDVIIGFLIAAIFLRSAIRVLSQSVPLLKTNAAKGSA